MKSPVVLSWLSSDGAHLGVCGQLSEIELNDGSVVRGEVLSLDEAHCTLRSESLGRFSSRGPESKPLE